jgi:hypothetical protein
MASNLKHANQSSAPSIRMMLKQEYNSDGQRLVNEIWSEAHALYKACGVFVLDPKIRNWLRKNDQKALEQGLKALGLI